MRKLVVWDLVTLDGYFEGPRPWDLDWHSTVWGDELERLSIEQLRSADGLLFGRATYEGMASHWPTAEGEVADLMNRIPKVVFSRTLATADWNNTRIVREDAEKEVARLKREARRDLLIFGSAKFVASLMPHGLIDEYRVCVAPLLLGGGTPLFRPSPTQRRLKLLEARSLKSGGVILRYQPEGQP